MNRSEVNALIGDFDFAADALEIAKELERESIHCCYMKSNYRDTYLKMFYRFGTKESAIRAMKVKGYRVMTKNEGKDRYIVAPVCAPVKY